MSDEKGALAHQTQGTMLVEIPSQAKNFPILVKSPLQAAL
jgi:hypothetical protein